MEKILGEVNVIKGLENVIADKTKISQIDSQKNVVIARGYRLNDLVAHTGFEQVASLLLDERLLGFEEAAAKWMQFKIQYRPAQEVREGVAQGADPSLALQAIVAMHGLSLAPYDWQDAAELRRRAWLIAVHLPFWVASLIRPDLDIEVLLQWFKQDDRSSGGFLSAVRNSPAPEKEIQLFDQLRSVYCEHGFNAATFTARVVSSTVNDIHSAVSAAQGALKGHLHGGAVALVCPMLDEAHRVGARNFIEAELREKRKVMGFGHRIYQGDDSRFPMVLEILKALSDMKSEPSYYQTVLETKRIMQEVKGVHPNLDLAGAPSFKLLGFESRHMVNLIAMGRVLGWCAHIIEQSQNNRIIRPDSEYVGDLNCTVSEDLKAPWINPIEIRGIVD